MQIVVKQDRLEQTVTVGQLLEMQSGRIDIVVSIMANFVLDDNGAYLPPAKGLEVIKSLTIAEMKAAAGDFSKKVVDAAVPPQNASDSGAQFTQEQQPPQLGL